jgi:hypothetical protein
MLETQTTLMRNGEVEDNEKTNQNVAHGADCRGHNGKLLR